MVPYLLLLNLKGSNPSTQPCRKTALAAILTVIRNVTSRQSGLSLSWLGSNSSDETSSSFGWFSRYVGSFLLTIGGSIVSALSGYAIKELPSQLRSAPESARKYCSVPPKRQSLQIQICATQRLTACAKCATATRSQQHSK